MRKGEENKEEEPGGMQQMTEKNECENRQVEKETFAEYGRNKLNQMLAQDPRDYRRARKLKTEFKVCVFFFLFFLYK